jgi:opacity protein-like surface antigen
MNQVRKLLWVFLAVLVIASTAYAEEGRGEVSFNVGWIFSDGVTGDNFLAPNGNVYNRIDPKDSFAWGFTGEYYVTDNVEAGFRFNRQQSQLEISGPSVTTEVGDMKVDGYHGIFSYNFGDHDAGMRPFVYGGLGATHFGGVTFQKFNGTIGETSTLTKFSTTWGGGVKLHASEHIGVRAEVNWTPTHIKTDEEGWWCDPYWGCYVVGNPQYSNQFGFSGGLNLRF